MKRFVLSVSLIGLLLGGCSGTLEGKNTVNEPNETKVEGMANKKSSYSKEDLLLEGKNLLSLALHGITLDSSKSKNILESIFVEGKTAEDFKQKLIEQNYSLNSDLEFNYQIFEEEVSYGKELSKKEQKEADYLYSSFIQLGTNHSNENPKLLKVNLSLKEQKDNTLGITNIEIMSEEELAVVQGPSKEETIQYYFSE